MMVDVAKAAEHALSKCRYNAGAFYGAAERLSLGVGLFYDNVLSPVFDEQEEVFDTGRSLVYVLTHECDVDQDNERNFNDHVLVCPVTKFDGFALAVVEAGSEDELYGMLPDLSADKVFRVFYLPPMPAQLTFLLPFGGFLYLNQISSIHVSVFWKDDVSKVCALSSYGQRLLDFKLENHLLRAKVERLPRLM